MRRFKKSGLGLIPVNNDCFDLKKCFATSFFQNELLGDLFGCVLTDFYCSKFFVQN